MELRRRLALLPALQRIVGVGGAGVVELQILVGNTLDIYQHILDMCLILLFGCLVLILGASSVYNVPCAVYAYLGVST